MGNTHSTPHHSLATYPASESEADLSPFGRHWNNHDGIAAGFTRVALSAGRAGFTRVALITCRTLGAGITLGSGCALRSSRTWRGSRRGWDIDHSRFVASAQTENRYERY